MPVIHCLKSADKACRQEMFSLLKTEGGVGDPSDDGSNGSKGNRRIHELIASSESVEYANAWASRLIEQAKASLEGLADSPARSLLMEMADTVLTRKF